MVKKSTNKKAVKSTSSRNKDGTVPLTVYEKWIVGLASIAFIAYVVILFWL